MPVHHRHFTESELHRQCEAILLAWGCTARTAGVVADVLSYADISGIDSHGISMFINYEKLLAGDELDTGASPELVAEHGATARVDGNAGLGHPAAVMAMELAVGKAAEHGIGAVSVTNSHHFGAAGYYPLLAARKGLIGIATTSARSVSVVPTGGAEPRLPTNPLAFAAPAADHPPFVLDMSTSTVAVNKLKVHALEQRTLPEGWFVDGEGKPVSDAATALAAAHQGRGGGLTPLGGPAELGGHKGYGLSMMVQILSSALSGGALAVTRKPEERDNIGHFLLAIDPAPMRGDGGFGAAVTELVDAMHATTPSADADRVLVAGEPEHLTRAHRGEHGIPLPSTLLTSLEGICERTSAPFLLG